MDELVTAQILIKPKIFAFLDLNTVQILMKPKGVGYVSDEELESDVHITIEIIPGILEVTCSNAAVGLVTAQIEIIPRRLIGIIRTADETHEIIAELRLKARPDVLTPVDSDPMSTVLSGLRNGVAQDPLDFNTGTCALFGWQTPDEVTYDVTHLDISFEDLLPRLNNPPEHSEFSQSQGACLSGDGQFIIKLADWIHYARISTDGGDTFENLTSLDPDAYWSSIACSADGKYVLASCSTHRYNYNLAGTYVSSDYGATFTLMLPFRDGGRMCSVSPNGKYMSLAIYAYGEGWVQYSEDYGATWNSHNQSPFFHSHSNNALSYSYDGQYQLYVCNGALDGSQSLPLLSTDYGETWTVVSSVDLNGWRGANISDDGRCMILATSSSIFYVSTDYGATFNHRHIPGLSGSAYNTKPGVGFSGEMMHFWGPMGIIASCDFGETWEILANVNTDPAFDPAHHTNSAVSRDGLTIIYVGFDVTQLATITPTLVYTNIPWEMPVANCTMHRVVRNLFNYDTPTFE